MSAVDDLAWAGAAEQSRLVRSGAVSAREVVEATLERIARLQPRLNAFRVVLAERALVEAERHLEVPLAGLPVAIKDDTTGPPVTRNRLASCVHCNGVGGRASMESKAIDPADFRDAQHRQWDSAAVGWKEWSEFSESGWGHISERLVELADVQPGRRVLDVAAGYGEPALTAARKAAPEGRVVATDISAEMLAFGRERAAAAGLDNVEFVQSDACSLDFPHASFDAAVSRWGIIFEPDAEAAAGRIRGFLKPGARMAISSWGEPDEVPFLSIPMRTMMQRLDVPPPPAGTPGIFSRPTPDSIGGLLEGGGFSNIAIEQAEVTFEFDSPEQFTAYIRAVSAPIRAMIEQHAGDAQEEAWDAITQAAAGAGGGSKPLRFSNVVLLASATA